MTREKAGADRKILVADDIPRNVRILRDRLENEGYRVVEASDGAEALRKVDEENPDLLLLDMVMPVLNGYQVLERMRADGSIRRVPVIVISAVDQVESVAKCIELGADDYLCKPFNAVLLRARIGNCLERKRLNDLESDYRGHLERQVKEQVREISLAQLGIIFAMSKLAESRDTDTGMHLERIREYCRILSRRLTGHPVHGRTVDAGFQDVLYTASALHDIGKVGVPDSILRKPGKLSADEFAVMKTHSEIGAETLRAVERKNPNNAFVRIGIEIAENHHERWDGAGYPHGRGGEDIPLAGRIVALADVYDALVSKRCYKDALRHDETLDIIRGESGKHFDPGIVDCFLRDADEFHAVRAGMMKTDETMAPVS
jgi:putative two-component system response regulator